MSKEGAPNTGNSDRGPQGLSREGVDTSILQPWQVDREILLSLVIDERLGKGSKSSMYPSFEEDGMWQLNIAGGDHDNQLAFNDGDTASLADLERDLEKYHQQQRNVTGEVELPPAA